jgi:hypothetical protein
MIAGAVVMGFGYLMLARLDYGATRTDLMLASTVTGLGLGGLLQTYVLVVQNAATRETMGVSTAVVQLSRSAGASIGTALFGAILVSGMAREIPRHLPQGAGGSQPSADSGVGAILDPASLSGLSSQVETGIREGLAAAMQPVFVTGIMVVAAALIITLFIEELPLRGSTHAGKDGAGPDRSRELLLTGAS